MLLRIKRFRIHSYFYHIHPRIIYTPPESIPITALQTHQICRRVKIEEEEGEDMVDKLGDVYTTMMA